MSVLRGILAGLVLQVIMTTPVLADTQTGTRLTMHAVRPVDFLQTPCTSANGGAPLPNSLPCDEYIVDGLNSEQGRVYLVYVVVALAEATAGVGSVSFGLDFTPEELFAVWMLCADSEVITPGSYATPPLGITASWDPSGNCQRTELGDLGLGAGDVHAQAGFVYIYSYGAEGTELVLTPHPETEEIGPSLTDCNGVETVIPMPHVARLGLGTTEGYNPCLDQGVPAFPITWGKLKSLYE